MPSFKLPDDSFRVRSGERVVKQDALDLFNPSVLGLGDIMQEAASKPAIAALFDLQGFTIFCKQIEPHLSVPIYLSGFLAWIFDAIKKETARKRYKKGITLWHDLPFFTKFMGDGLLVLWDASNMDQSQQHNLIISCEIILDSYVSDFLPKMRRKVSDTPPVLRCGIAKGTVFSVGNGEDFVGSCINVAARLQKLAALPIAFAGRGFNPEKYFNESVVNHWQLMQVSIRGIGEKELVYIRKSDFENLPDVDKRLFKEP
jgi:class 3 adenylate cyclase